MERWQFIRWGIAASVLAHLLIAGGVVVSTTVRPYEIARTDEVAVDIVDADDPQKTPDPVSTPSPSPELTLPQLAPSPSPAAAAPPPAPEPAQPPVQEAKEMPKPPSPSPAQPRPSPMPPSKAVKTVAKPLPPPVPAPAPSYVPPEPDITVKYGVMLGLPEPLSPLPPAIGPDDAKDAGPAATTNLAANLETALRQRVRSCARLSASMSPSDRVMVRLRFAMTPDGRLATEPEVREVIAPLKAAQLKESAVEALNACQPYSMLPRDRYDEWKVIEMSFTPQDFTR
ncbi:MULTISPECIES: hypothetical protein [unclassified Bradyrhizobium]|uniref:hypothetical protein n=1 Tax=unclassified Bradyrhizobium TaxID=2631580 RepID=UPI0029165782|nr:MULTISPECIES: hypothetical protein [unclassified Bradyrhizobium]